jgi:hypothetical protein
MHVRCEGLELSFFWTASEWTTECGICDEPRVRARFRCHNSVVLRCIIAGVQLENNGVMLPKFHSDSLLITNLYFVGHSWVGLGPTLSYRHV